MDPSISKYINRYPRFYSDYYVATSSEGCHLKGSLTYFNIIFLIKGATN